MPLELKQRDSALIIVVSRKLLAAMAQQSGGDPTEIRILDRFQIRDPQLEHLGWALKAEMESGYPGGPVYLG